MPGDMMWGIMYYVGQALHHHRQDVFLRVTKILMQVVNESTIHRSVSYCIHLQK